MVLMLTLVPQSVEAAETDEAAGSVTVYFSLQKGGVFEIGPALELEVYDGLAEEYGYTSESENPTILDAVVAAHRAYYGDAFTKETAGQYLDVEPSSYGGYYFAEIFGSMNGLGYYQNHVSAWGPGDEVRDRADLDFFFYQDTVYWSDIYSYFNQNEINAKVGDTVELEYDYSGYDADWNPVSAPFDGTQGTVGVYLVKEDGSLDRELTDAQGNMVSIGADGTLSLSFEEAGIYYITVSGTDAYGSALVMPHCRISVEDVINVSVSYQHDGSFDGMPMKSLEVYSGLAEEYGYIWDYEEPTILDAMVAAHKAYYGDSFTKDTAKEYLDVESGDYGSYFVNAFQSGSGFGYYVNHAMAWGPSDVLKDGDYLDIFFYQDTMYWSDVYSYMEQYEVTAAPNENIELNYYYSTYDANWNPVSLPFDGTKGKAEVYLLKEDGTLGDALTDGDGNAAAISAEGKIVLSFAEEGIYYITVSGTDAYGSVLVQPYCKLNIDREGNNPGENDDPVTVPGEEENPEDIEVDPDSDYADIYRTTGEYLVKNLDLSFGNEWKILGLARAGLLTEEAVQKYYHSVEEYGKAVGSDKLSSTKSTVNSRVIIALTAIGKDVTNVSGYNLLKPLADFDYVSRQGINGIIFALIALDTNKYDIPAVEGNGTQTTRENLIAAIKDGLQKEADAGKLALGVDLTAMAVQALAPYYNSDQEVKAVVDSILVLLSDSQKGNGGFGEGITNVQTTAQVVVALTSLGIDPEKDERFVKNGKSPVDVLNAFYVQGGGFYYDEEGIVNSMATEQAYYALVSYDRLLKGQNSLYDMSEEKNSEKQEESPNTGDETRVLVYLFAAAAALAALYGGRKVKESR